MQGKYLSWLIAIQGIWLVFDPVLSQGGKKPPPPPTYSTDLEVALREELFITNNYSVLQRPSQKVFVKVSLTVLTVNDLSIRDQTLSISAYLDLKWDDSRLGWFNTATTSQDYSNVPFLFSTESYTWRPVLLIENSVEHLSVISDPSTPMRINSRGGINWNPSGIYKVSCESDTTYYPLDNQECTIKLSSWAYTSNEVVLVFDNDSPIDLGFYSENGEWKLTEASASKSGTKSRKGTSFSSLTFSINLQRRPMFHIINTIFPVVLMAVLTSMVFKLPVDSGEKIGFSLTVLLAYAVYLTLISSEIPSTSVTLCYLSMYLAFILTLGAISVCLTIFVLSLHFRPEDEPVPKWLKTFTSAFLAKLACVKSPCVRRKRSKVGVVEQLAPTTKHKLSHTGKKMPIPIDMVDEDDDEVPELSWQQLSKIMDKVFFNIYISLICLVTIALFLIITSGYYNI